MIERAEADAAARRWIARYVTAWNSNDEADIRSLFTDDARYRYEPWSPLIEGSDAIVASWLERRDDPGTFTFEGDVAGIDGRTFFYSGVTRYDSGTVYSNLWVVALADGLERAESFTEWWMDQAEKSGD
ncbi:nuclear transport factor 2 family protein [Microbacterium sp. CFH 31415]|uniref:nuclear transport factor 2 family protein n=1 Tax=Microbacterium sp. CFH 31415 TaxID=2921732 RepID=UPI001F14216E|nr:nuclear transport factor 2 family protein [Microbacterium sp. CFH 31415]MCH6231068.1 nuclear transport factor 2 family protein [Microbacterium sp. CFH 31415]